MHTSTSTKESHEEGGLTAALGLPSSALTSSAVGGNQSFYLAASKAKAVHYFVVSCQKPILSSSWVYGPCLWGVKNWISKPLMLSFSRKPSSGVCAPESFQFALTFSRFAEPSAASKVSTLITSVLPPRRFKAFNFFRRPLCWSWQSTFPLTTFPRLNSEKSKAFLLLFELLLRCCAARRSCHIDFPPTNDSRRHEYYINFRLARELEPWTVRRQVGSQDMTLKLDLLASWLTRFDCRWFLLSCCDSLLHSHAEPQLEAESEEKNLPTINNSLSVGFVKLGKFCQTFCSLATAKFWLNVLVGYCQGWSSYSYSLAAGMPALFMTIRNHLRKRRKCWWRKRRTMRASAIKFSTRTKLFSQPFVPALKEKRVVHFILIASNLFYSSSNEISTFREKFFVSPPLSHSPTPQQRLQFRTCRRL